MGPESSDKKPSRREFLALAGAAALASFAGEKGARSSDAPAAPILKESATNPEYVSEEEVREVLGKLLGATPYKELSKRSDSDGLYILEVEVPASDGHFEYLYRRGRPNSEKKELPGFRIDRAEYDDTRTYVGGGSVAKKHGAIWRLTP